MPTLEEVLELAQYQSRLQGRTIAVYPETKHPSYFRRIGLPLEQRLITTLHRYGYRGKNAPVFVQSFEPSSLQIMRGISEVPMVQLLSASGQPEDFRLNGDSRNYAWLASADGLRMVAQYANGIGPDKVMVIPRDAQNRLASPTTLVDDAHKAGLIVHPYTFRPENPFLPAELRRGDVNSPTARGDLAGELARFLQTGIDGFFTDDPATGRAALDAFLRR